MLNLLAQSETYNPLARTSFVDGFAARTSFVDRVIAYRRSFPKSEVTDIQLLIHFHRGGDVYKNGALYFRAVGLPEGNEFAQEESFEGLKVSMRELIEGGISFSVSREPANFNEVGSEEGELKGFSEVEQKESSLYEPLTADEAAQIIWAVLRIELTELEAGSNLAGFVIPTLEEALNKFDKRQEELFGTGSVYDFYQLDPDLVFNARLSLDRGQVGRNWSYVNDYFFSEQEGVTTDQCTVSDQNFQKIDQYYHRWERTEAGAFDFDAELETAKEVNLYSELFDSEGKNLGFADQFLYYRHQAKERETLMYKYLWKINSWPLHWLPKAMNSLRSKFRNSVRACSPGPANYQDEQGIWHNAPLEGQAAIDYVRENIPDLKGKKASKNFRFHKCSNWNELILTREQMNILERAYDNRMEDKSYLGLPVAYFKVK